MCTVHTSSFAHDLFKMYRPDFPAMHNESLVEIYGKYLPNFRYRWLADIIPTHHKLLASSGMTFNNIFYIQKLRVLFNRHFIQQQTLFSLCVCILYCIDAIALDVCLCSLAGKRYAISRRKKNTFDTFKFPLQMLLQAVKEIEAPKWGKGGKKTDLNFLLAMMMIPSRSTAKHLFFIVKFNNLCCTSNHKATCKRMRWQSF